MLASRLPEETTCRLTPRRLAGTFFDMAFNPSTPDAAAGPPRLALVTTETTLAGAERVVLELARAFDGRGSRVLVVSLQDPAGHDGLHTRLAEAGIAFESCSLNRKTKVLHGLGRLRHSLDAFSPHLVHSHLFHANAACAWVSRGRPWPLVTTHHIVERRRLPWRYRIDRLVDRRVCCHVAVSRAVARHQSSCTGIPEHRFRVVYNGTALPGADLSVAEPGEVRRRLGVPPEVAMLLSVGRLDPQKGFVEFVPVVARLLARFESMVWVVAGDGPCRAELIEATERAGIGSRVHLPGFVREVDLLYRGAEALVMPSRWEGFGLVAVEAMARRCPVAASAVDSLPEIIDDGRTGLLFDVDTDPTDRLIDWLDDPSLRRRQAEAAEDEVRRRFSLETMVDNYASLFDELTGRPW